MPALYRDVLDNSRGASPVVLWKQVGDGPQGLGQHRLIAGAAQRDAHGIARSGFQAEGIRADHADASGIKRTGKKMLVPVVRQRQPDMGDASSWRRPVCPT